MVGVEGKSLMLNRLLQHSEKRVLERRLRRRPELRFGVTAATVDAFRAQVAAELLSGMDFDLICDFQVLQPPAEQISCRIYSRQGGSCSAAEVAELLGGSGDGDLCAFTVPNLFAFQQLWAKEEFVSEGDS
ncbi:unnamed protein product [Polarella glacialis]|uniref:Uncharacterized protein n=1 Tax=Polarella glacialis TaxID=89957 RepID=A0A813K573_POLGL|nr:unnamed protein product [Polarella glacialis]